MESTHKAQRFSNLSDTVHPDQGTGEIGDPKPKAGGGVGSLAGGVNECEAVLCANPKPEHCEVSGFAYAFGDIVAVWGGRERVLEAPESGNVAPSDSSCLMAVYGRLAERWQG